MEEIGLRWLLGQGVSLVALTLCIVAFASKRDDRLFVLLLFANVAFAAQFALFESWVAAGISALIVLRIALVRRFRRNRALMLGMLLATLAVAALTWSGPRDIPALAAGLLGTYGMFMLSGIPMRLALAGAALCWVASNVLAGSIGGTVAESLIFLTNVFTMLRLRRDARVQYPASET
ncbi:YgjV family protein [Halomonas sp. MCCC 1A17488]|uniref:YgjV family protein n=1 Tax=Billgrantia sulfidoxydans TaxID=2733484 RepID=A0ABX7W949_9GAMM|nr:MULTISPECIES: YgjV family protein [Halomonas]MCE8017740.1 YgjV family protein [Halomonas sp. MCCC 1A17488]MCG3241073.1 YgjV family protein [Halomonas sp. MCCC 1A17488]QPP48933.1 YgjV family protein [Halomonas sp. SS10-MC5]QTP56252.1 YgjV family protein [Halomonas sulfidoxydans]